MRAPARWLVLAFVTTAFACTGEKYIRLLEPEATGGSGTGGGAPDAGDLVDAVCTRWTAEREPEHSLLMLAVDVSGSMMTRVTSDRDRWGIERPILSDAIGALPPRVGVGAVFYPNQPTAPSQGPRPVSACVNVDTIVPVDDLGPPDSRQRAWLEGALDVTAPNAQAGSPTLDAYLVSLAVLGNTTLAGTRQILLLTDGHPTFSENCVGTGRVDDPVDYRPIVSAIAAARRAGVRTFVVGSPGSELTNPAGDDARPYLSLAAEAGGTAAPGCSHSGPRYCHFDMVREPDFGRGLEAALADVSRSVIRCDIQVPDPPQGEQIDPGALNVVFKLPGSEDELIPNDGDSSCASGSGWHYDDDGRRIVLCEETCNRVHADARGALEFLSGCATVVR